MNTLYLNDDDQMIRAKIMKAKTDQGPDRKGTVMPDYIAGLFTLLKIVSPSPVSERFEEDFREARIRYLDLKMQLAEDIVRFIAPIREKTLTLMGDEKYMQRAFEQGASKARSSAKATLQLVRDAMGIKYH